MFCIFRKGIFIMTIIRKMIYENEPLTSEEIEEIERASKVPITFDEDCPELDAEQLQKLTAIAKKQRAEHRKSLCGFVKNSIN